MKTQLREDGYEGCIGLSNLYIAITLLGATKLTKQPLRAAVGLLVQLEREWGSEARPSH